VGESPEFWKRERMSAAEKFDLVSVEDYLEAELSSPVKHEYMGGAVYAMAGANIQHNRIAINLTSSLHLRLRGRKCQPFNSDMKIRVRFPAHVRFYYPDASVICRSGPRDESFQSEASVIFEVMSRSTRRIDAGEKKDAYLRLRTLDAYVLLEQDEIAAQVYRRASKGFVREVYAGADAIVPFPTLGIDLPLAEVYEGWEPPARLMEDAEEYGVSEEYAEQEAG
jgi:Uma2 family endonuclease